jgi:hypothetical protein
MIEHLHPDTSVTLDGILLGQGAMLRGSDWYASTVGTWQQCPIPGLIIKQGCKVLWIRPNKLSCEAKSLLTYLTQWNFYLTERHWWIVIPSPRWKHDSRMDWKVLNPECVQELREYGLIYQYPYDETVYELTEAGRLAGKQLLQ